MPDTYYFCEAGTPGSKSAWHIRRLKKIGRNVIASEDTPTLCGLTVSKHLKVLVTNHALPLACPKCVSYYRRAVKA
jgi:hypothetical protein